MHSEHKLAAIVFADIAGYTALMREDESKALRAMSIFKRALESEVPQYNGKIIQFFGDGCLMAFDSSLQAVEASVALQHAYIKEQVPVRFGLHMGDVVYRENNVFGDGVNVASRIESMGIPGAVLMSKTIRDQIRNKQDYQLVSLGGFQFKNVDESIEVYALANEGFTVPEAKQLGGKMAGDRSRRKHRLVPLIGILIFVVLGVVLWLKFGNVQKSIDKPAERSIAVMPFDIVADQTNEQTQLFSLGMHDDLITNLTRIDSLKVISQFTIRQYASSTKQPKAIAEELGVASLLLGNVHQIGSKVRVNVSLVNPFSGANRWSYTYDSELTAENIFEIQSHLTNEIIAQLAIELTPSSARAMQLKPTDDLEAYFLFQQGMQSYRKGLDADDLEDAVHYFELAVSKDPGYAVAWGGLAMATLTQLAWHSRSEELLVPVINEAADQALSIDSLLAEAYIAKGHLANLQLRFAEAEPLLLKALKLAPSNSEAHIAYSELLRNDGHVQEAVTAVKQALNLDPRSMRVNTIYLQNLYFNKQFDDVISVANQILSRDSSFAVAYYWIGITSAITGQKEQGITNALEAVRLAPDNAYFQAAIAYAYASAGETKLALDFLHQAGNLNLPLPEVGLVYIQLGDFDKAFEYFNRALEREPTTLHYMRTDPATEPVRNDPRWDLLMKRIDDIARSD